MQHGGKPYRVLDAFDPKRNAVLLLAGNKTGTNRWYHTHVPRAEKLFTAYLKERPGGIEENAMMTRKFSDLTKKMSAKDRAEIKTRSKKLLAQLPLEQLRSARSLTQTNMAQILGVNQSAISKIEKRTDMYLSTLRSYVEAMGGSLEIRAVFPEGAVRVDIFSDK